MNRSVTSRFAACVAVLVATAIGSCASQRRRALDDDAPQVPQLTPSEVTRLIPANIKDRAQWSDAVLSALHAHQQDATLSNVCSVLAIIEQESTYQANPGVPGLGGVIQKRLDVYAGKLGPLGQPALHALLDGKAPGRKQTFLERLKHAKTERDVDITFRELSAHYEDKFPRAYAVADLLGGLFSSTHIEDLNPVTTGGSMQVSVRYATELGHKRRMTTTQVRDELYTREGGVYYGTARLLGYTAAYDRPIYRFADYNAGVYASRNAALQAQVAELTGIKLTCDGDILAYSRAGDPKDDVTQTLKAFLAWRARFAPKLTEHHLKSDVHYEKMRTFEETDTFRLIRRTYEEKKHKKPAYAQVPEVAIHSPKMSRDRSTSWYARNVQLRFDACRQRFRKGEPGARRHDAAAVDAVLASTRAR